MTSATNMHPSMDELCDYRDRVHDATYNDAGITAHVAACDSCQQTLAFLTTLARTTSQFSAPDASEALRARVLESAAAATVTPDILATMTPGLTMTTRAAAKPARSRQRWVSVAAVAAALCVVTLGSLLTDTPEMMAGETAGTMDLSTVTPRNGEAIDVHYTPGASLSRFPTLRLRARMRTSDAESYPANIPVVTVATLQQQRDGSYRGSFLLPDSLVYAALAVEDTNATEIDDRDGRTWEVLRAGVNGKVMLAAVDQRANDHMGRSWEEIFVTARRMVTEYPDSIAAWSYLATTHSWMGLSTDSIRTSHIERVRAFDRQLRTSASPSADDMGRMYWYARGMDSTSAAAWDVRLRREAPSNSFIVQNRLLDVLGTLRKDHDTTAALRGFESIWADAPVDRKAQVGGSATSIAVASGDTMALRRWTDRMLGLATASTPRISRISTARRVASDFARVPALRAEGLQRLRDELTRLRAGTPLPRNLDETRDAYYARVDRAVRSTYAALGRALALDGQHRAALDTLTIAAAQAWDTDVFRAVRTEALALGDTAAALDVGAKLSIDPRTSQERATVLNNFGTAQVGATLWQNKLKAARRDVVLRTLGAVRPRTIARAVPVQSLDGKTVNLHTSLTGQVTVVAFLSRFCGPAIDVLPALHRIATRLGENGVRTVAIFKENKTSADLTAFLRKHDVTLPVLLDHDKAASNTFNQWGTPYFYVVDDRGRIMSERTSHVDELLVNAEAVRLASVKQ